MSEEQTEPESWLVKIISGGCTVAFESSSEPVVLDRPTQFSPMIGNITTTALWWVDWSHVTGFCVNKKVHKPVKTVNEVAKIEAPIEPKTEAQSAQIDWAKLAPIDRRWGDVAASIIQTGVERKTANKIIRDALQSGVIASKGKYPSVMLRYVYPDSIADF